VNQGDGITSTASEVRIDPRSPVGPDGSALFNGNIMVSTNAGGPVVVGTAALSHRDQVDAVDARLGQTLSGYQRRSSNDNSGTFMRRFDGRRQVNPTGGWEGASYTALRHANRAGGIFTIGLALH
jgi:hypothetical protein